MFDPFLTQKHAKGQLNIIDYRNAKFQGTAQQQTNDRPAIGMLLDHNYLLALGHWKSQLPQGPTFLVFPDGSLFFGPLANGFPNGVCSYLTPLGANIYCSFSSEGPAVLAFEDSQGSTLQRVQVQPSTLKELTQDGQHNQNILAELYLSQLGVKEIKVGKSHHYADDNQKNVILKEWMGNLPRQQTNYQQFIKHNFGQQEVFQIVENKSLFQFKFKKSSIACKIANTSSLTIDSLGFYNQVTLGMEYSRKNYGNGQLEEAIGKEIAVYSSTQRPHQCLVALDLYYKMSLSFVNEYRPIDYLYRVKFIFHAFQILLKKLPVAAQGQKLLENPNQSTGRPRIILKQEKVPQASLQKIKADVYRAVRAKSLSRSSLGSVSNPRSTKKYDDHSIYTAILNQSKISSRYSPVKVSPMKVANLRANSPKRGTPNRQSQKLNHTVLPSQAKRSNEKYPWQSRRTKSPLSKFVYLDESRKLNQRRMDNIRILTEHYEEIEKDLKKESKPSKLFSYYEPTNQKRSSLGTSTILGPRKVLKYEF